MALADPESQLFGRNFDWMYSPAVLLFTDPPDGYAAAALVDIAFLGFEGSLSLDLADRPLDELVPLLSTPHIPFDGLNETGLAIAMAAVDPGDVPVDPDKETIGSLGIMRLVLDKAATVEEAVDLIGAFNINFEGGPPLHYLVADADGNAALVEFHEGEMVVVPSEAGWHQAPTSCTRRSSRPGTPAGATTGCTKPSSRPVESWTSTERWISSARWRSRAPSGPSSTTSATARSIW